MAGKTGSRLTKTQWLEAEELYRQGWTQRELGDKYGIRPETVSIHMNKAKVKGGEHVDVVRQELQEALQRKLKEFAEKRANRQIDTKEKFHTLINSLLAFYVKDLKRAQDAGASLEKVSGAAKALKESIMGLKMAREELYTLLEIRPETNLEDIPDLMVMSMSAEDEERIRGSGSYLPQDDEEEEAPEPDLDVSGLITEIDDGDELNG